MTRLILTETKLDIGTCFDEALRVYKKNFLLLVLAAIVYELLVLFSLLILTGPLWGGFCFMLLNAFRREDKTIVFGDLFRMLHRFWPLFLLFVVQTILMLLGAVLFVIPMLILNCLFLYTELLMVDRHFGVMDSLQGSCRIALEKGFWMHFLLGIIYLALVVAPSIIPYVGWLAGFLTIPLASLVITSAYLQQVQVEAGQPGEGPITA